MSYTYWIWVITSQTVHQCILCIYMAYPPYLLNKCGQSPESLDRYYYYCYYRTRRSIVNVTTHNNTFVRIFITYKYRPQMLRYYIIMTTTRIRLFFIRFFLQSNARASRINYPPSRTRAAARHTIRPRAV